MPEMTEYTPGTPSWVDLSTPDIEKAASFYAELFGWEVPESPFAEQTGGYRTATSRGKSVGGVMPLMAEGQPTAWSSYVSVEDADATVAKVREAGGSVIAEPLDVMNLGRMAVFADPTGAVVGVWQPREMKGAVLVNEPVSLTWNELNTRDPEAAASFYSAIFGWSAEALDGGGHNYKSFNRPDGAIAGLVDMNELDVPAEVPPHWLVYFAVEDTDATIAKTEGLGGAKTFGPIDIPIGRFAILTDDQGASFAVIATA